MTPQDEAGAGAVDASLAGEAAPPAPVPEPQPGDTCGDRAGLQANAAWPLAGGCPTRSGVTALNGPSTAKAEILFPYAGGESAPAVDVTGFIWVGTTDGIVYAITPTGTFARARRIGTSIVATPAIAANGNAIVGTTDGTLYGLSTQNTQPPANDAGTDAGADASAGAGGVDAGGEGGGEGDGAVAGADVLFVSWSLPLGAPIRSSPVIGPDSTIYVGTTIGKLVAAKQTPALTWQAETGDTFGSSPALARDGSIYVGSTDHKLHAFEPSGREKWATDLGAEIHASPAVGGDGTVYVGTVEGKLHAVDPSGKIKWTYAGASGAFVGAPAVYRGGVYAASEDKRIHAVNVVDGSPRWTFLTLGTPRTPLVNEDGNVFFGASDGKIYVTTPKGGLRFAATAKGAVTSGAAITAQSFLLVSTERGLSILGP